MNLAKDSYDYIIVGAGSAGCVLANRLTASGRHRVLLVEAGAKDHFWTHIPLGFGKLIDHPTANWRYRSTPEEALGMREIPVPRGRLLGGSSAINGLVFVRGQPIDYNTWRDRGATGWGYEDVLPYFKKMENFDRGEDTLRGRSGPLKVRESIDQSPIYEAFFAAGAEAGLHRNPDYNGSSQEGVARTQATIFNGQRMSAAVCYLKPAMNRTNLDVITGALVSKLLIENKRCVGICYSISAGDGQTVQARAGIETILCAGAINSPQLLELSGIGRPEVLKEAGIDVVHELPGVGENLQDHVTPRLKWQVTQKRVTYNDRSQGLGMAWEALRYVFGKKGMLNIPSGPLIGFFRSRTELSIPDCQLIFVPFQIDDQTKRTLAKEPGVTIPLYQLRPTSTGSVHIKSDRAEVHPTIRFNFFSTELDRQTTIDGVRFIRNLVNTSALDAFRGRETSPGPDVQTDDEIIDWARQQSETSYHVCGTCTIGQNKDAVVDPRLRVHGIAGLRVADASVMPTVASGNINAACIMVGEKAADIILEDSAAP